MRRLMARMSWKASHARLGPSRRHPGSNKLGIDACRTETDKVSECRTSFFEAQVLELTFYFALLSLKLELVPVRGFEPRSRG